MYSYAALVGHQPHLSTAELASVFADLVPGHWFEAQFFTFQTATEIDQTFFTHLGGTQLIARAIVGTSSVDVEDIPSLLFNELSSVKGKAVFSLRLLGFPRSVVRTLLRDCKQHLKHRGIPNRYIGNEDEPAKAIQLSDEGITDPKKGCEIVILRDEERLWIGRTVAVQDVKGYALRDIGKPVRDTTVGLLPPKLAQILLNFGQFLAQRKRGDVRHETRDMGKNQKGDSSLKSHVSSLTVLDPFCGTGVIPLEAMLRGWHVLASDVSVKAVNGCEKNIEWLRQTYKIPRKDVEATVWKQDALKPFALKSVPDVVVTEGTLGPNLRERPTQRDAERIMRQIEDLVADFLANAKATLPQIPIVMAWPVWYARKEILFLPDMLHVCAEHGYRMVLPPHVRPSRDDRSSLLYRRGDQFVGREIVLLLPKKK